MTIPRQSYIICATPRSGSHLLAGGLSSTAACGFPVERFPRVLSGAKPTATQLDSWVTRAPDEVSYDHELDTAYIKEILELGTTKNGVFGVTIHWFQLQDAIHRIGAYVGNKELSPSAMLSEALPNLSFIWLTRRDKVAQAVSWYKAIESGNYVKRRDYHETSATAEIPFDFKRISAYLSALKSSDNGWKYFFKQADVRPLLIEYEVLVNNYRDTINTVLNFLQIDTKNLIIDEPKYQKLADDQSREWIEKFKTMS
ncbi:MAG: Stf0 family sulfotransferase [Aliidongia sp.]